MPLLFAGPTIVGTTLFYRMYEVASTCQLRPVYTMPSRYTRGASRKRSATITPLISRATDNSPPQEEKDLLSAIDVYAVEPTSAKPSHILRTEHVHYKTLCDKVSALERSAGFSLPKQAQKHMTGTWRLALTDSAAVDRNNGSITGLSKLPGATCSSVAVTLDQNGSARTVETVRWLAVTTARNCLTGKWRFNGRGNDLLEVTYAEAVLFGRFSFRADSKAVVRTTYCSRGVRVGRSRSGEFYVFVRE